MNILLILLGLIASMIFSSLPFAALEILSAIMLFVTGFYMLFLMPVRAGEKEWVRAIRIFIAVVIVLMGVNLLA